MEPTSWGCEYEAPLGWLFITQSYGTIGESQTSEAQSEQSPHRPQVDQDQQREIPVHV
jgi:hypothetical protein